MNLKRIKGYASIENMTKDEMIREIISSRAVIAQLRQRDNNNRISAVDRNGKKYTRKEVIEVFERLYHESPKAIRLLFPTMSANSINKRAQLYEINNKKPRSTEREDEVIRRLYPDYEKMALELGRTKISVYKRAYALGLKSPSNKKVWTEQEDALLRMAKPVPNRKRSSCEKRRKVLGINGTFLRQVLALSADELRRTIDAAFVRRYPDQVHSEAIQTVIQWCLEGKCSIKPEYLREAVKKAITETYRIHPDRGAPISMDAKLYDDGGTTVGDRISSDAFHF